ncbi:hypothetical protein [Paraburkholderia caffeinilytica]|uniref:hypothetical protein n=1 Tax=Paraburkholderia caffeinilytica TaxID=1761016 RepID=UPI003DA06C6F
MDHYWEANAHTTAPPVPSKSSGTYPTDGNPVTVTPPTTPGAWWYYQITEEIRNAIVKLGGTPDFTRVDQLASALVASIGSAISGMADQLAKVAYSGSYNDLKNQPAIQAPLGFTPVQQGGGISQAASKVCIGWDGGGLRATVDSTDEGRFVFETELQANMTNLQNNINNVASSAGNGWTRGNLQPLNVNGIGYVAFIVKSGDSSQSANEGTVAALPGRPGSWLSSGNAASSGDHWCVWTRIA